MGTQINHLLSLCLAFLVLLREVKSEESKTNHGFLTTLVKLPQRLVAHVNYFDKINVDARLNDLPFVDNQIKCLVYDGPCDHFGTRARALLPSVILDNCRLCTNLQKNKLSRVVVYLQQNYPAAWRDALVKYGGAPKFITAGHVAPQVPFFGGSQNWHKKESVHVQEPIRLPTSYEMNPVLPTPESMNEYNLQSAGILLMPAGVYFQPSSAPEPIPAVESPSPVITEPTQSPFGTDLTSSAQPPSTPVVESTIELKPTTLEPFTFQME